MMLLHPRCLLLKKPDAGIDAVAQPVVGSRGQKTLQIGFRLRIAREV
jgi:hypothetical protein